MNVHRKIYTEEYGAIPKGYDIHHIDGNHSNNDISNLKAVSKQEHYDIHYAQGDYGACHRIAQRMDMTNEEISRIASAAASKGNREGKCGFILGHASRAGKVGGKKGGEYAKKNKTGIFALTKEQHKQRHANSVISRLVNAGKMCRIPQGI